MCGSYTTCNPSRFGPLLGTDSPKKGGEPTTNLPSKHISCLTMNASVASITSHKLRRSLTPYLPPLLTDPFCYLQPRGVVVLCGRLLPPVASLHNTHVRGESFNLQFLFFWCFYLNARSHPSPTQRTGSYTKDQREEGTT